MGQAIGNLFGGGSQQGNPLAALGSLFGGGVGPQTAQQDLGGGASAYGADFNPMDYLSGDPAYQAQQAVPAGTTPDPTTGAPSSPGAGQTSGDYSAGNLSGLRDLIMSTTTGRPAGGTPGIDRPPPAPGQPTAPAWFLPQQPGSTPQAGSASAFGGPTAMNPLDPNPTSLIPTPRARPAQPAAAPAPAPTPAPTPAPPPAVDPSTTDLPSIQGGGLPAATPIPDISGDSMPELQAAGIVGPGTDLNALPTTPPTTSADTPARPRPQTFSDLLLGNPDAQAAVGPVQAGATAPLQARPSDAAADVPMESGVSGAQPSDQPQPTVTNVPVRPNQEQAPADTQPPSRQDQQPTIPPEILQRILPQLLESFLFGGPRGLAMSLPMLALQAMMGRQGGGQYGRDGPDGQDQGQDGIAPWMAAGGRAPRGTDPYRYRQMTSQELADYRRSGNVPSATEKPQFLKNPGETIPKRITPTRETPAATPVNLPSTGGATPLDPFTTGAISPATQTARAYAPAAATPAGISAIDQAAGGPAGAETAPLSWPRGANFMRGQYGGPGANLTEIRTPGGVEARVNRAAAPAFNGFLRELEAAGAPIQGTYGFANRNIAGSRRLSQHAFGNAIDIGQESRDVAPRLRRWIQNPQNLATLHRLQLKYNIASGGDWSGRGGPDFGHFEWMGPRQYAGGA